MSALDSSQLRPLLKTMQTDSNPSTPGPLAMTNPMNGTSIHASLVPKKDASSSPSSAGSETDTLPLTLSARLRLATAQAHEDVMMPKLMTALVKGELSSSIHLEYLMMLFSVYSTLETALEQHSTHPHLSPVYNPALLARAPALDSDCVYFTGQSDWRKLSPEAKNLREGTCEPLEIYVNRLKQLGEADEAVKGKDSATLLLAHSYVRYLGDLSGGQTIAKTIRKAYKLPETGEGSQFYEFYLPADSNSATGLPERAGLAETKKIKTLYRQQLDTAGELMTEEEILNVLEEAKKAFHYNLNLFATFDERIESEKSKPLPNLPEDDEIAKADHWRTGKLVPAAKPGQKPILREPNQIEWPVIFMCIALLAGLYFVATQDRDSFDTPEKLSF